MNLERNSIWMKNSKKPRRIRHKKPWKWGPNTLKVVNFGSNLRWKEKEKERFGIFEDEMKYQIKYWVNGLDFAFLIYPLHLDSLPLKHTVEVGQLGPWSNGWLAFLWSLLFVLSLRIYLSFSSFFQIHILILQLLYQKGSFVSIIDVVYKLLIFDGYVRFF